MRFSSTALLRLAESFQYLRVLSFATEESLRVDTMQTLVKHCPGIEEISIRSPSDNGLLPLTDLERLHTLALSDTNYKRVAIYPYESFLEKLKEHQLRSIRLECIMNNGTLELLARQHGSLRTMCIHGRSPWSNRCTYDGNGLIPLALKRPRYLECLELELIGLAVDVFDDGKLPEKCFMTCKKLSIQGNLHRRAVQALVRV